MSLRNITPKPLPIIVNLISNVSDSSTILSQVTDILALPSLAPASIVTFNGLELKSIPDPARTHIQFTY